MTEQTEHLERVKSVIGRLVLEFCRKSDEFHMDELTNYVKSKSGVAPDSPGRILRDLRANGYIDYEVINRRKSLYRIIRDEVRQKVLF